MKVRYLFISLLLAGLFVLARPTFATESPTDPFISSPAYREDPTPTSTNVCGTIIHHTTWTVAQSPYIMTCDVVVINDVILTIEPGVVVKADSADDDLHIYGTLAADAAPDLPVVFTSFKDDSYGGDSNGDGNATSPAPGDWGGIYLHLGTYNNVVDNVIFRYGGSNAPQGAASLFRSDNEDVAVSSSTFEYSAAYGLYALGTTAVIDVNLNGNTFRNNNSNGFYGLTSGISSSTTLVNNGFQNNAGSGARLFLNDASGSLTLQGNSGSGNSVNGVELSGGINGAFTLNGSAQTGFEAVLVSDFTVKAGASLTLTENTTLKASGSATDLHIYGSLVSNGLPGSPVTITSINDNGVAGAGRGAGIAAAPGDWGGVYFHAGSSGNVLSNLDVAYGGSNAAQGANANLRSDNVDLTISDSAFRNSALDGLYFVSNSGSPSVTVQNSAFSDNAGNGLNLLANGAGLVANLTGNAFQSNATAARLLMSGGSGQVTFSGNTASDNGLNGFDLSGNLAGALTLDSLNQTDFPIVLNNDISIPFGSTLSLSANSIVKAGNSNVDVQVFGGLTAAGQPGQVVIFTSLKDDSVGGDTNGDGGATAPAAGDWGGVYFHDGSAGNTLSRCVIAYGGSNAAQGANANLRSDNASLTVSVCSLRASATDGAYLISNSGGRTFTLNNNTFQNNGDNGLEILSSNAAATVALTSNTFLTNQNAAARLVLSNGSGTVTLNGNTAAGNAVKGLALSGSVLGSLTIDNTAQTDFATVLSSDVVVSAGSTLSLSPGTVVKGADSATDLQLFGTLSANGTQSAPIYFTSFRDDTVGGDTNNDGGASSPAPGDWGGLYFHQGSVNNTLNRCFMAYGGSSVAQGANANLRSDNASLTVTNCVFRYSAQESVHTVAANATASYVFQNSAFRNNNGPGLFAWISSGSATHVLQTNVFENNAGPAVEIETFSGAGQLVLDGNTTNNNGANGVALSGSLAGSFTVSSANQSNFPLVMDDDLVVLSGGSLVLSPNTIVKAQSPTIDLHVFGSLTADGTPAQPIIFTTLEDDGPGGDTNNDGNATTGSPGDWGGIYLHENSPGGTLDNCVIRFGGSFAADGANANLRSRANALSVTRCSITSSLQDGIFLNHADSGPVVFLNNISGNAIYGLFNGGAVAISARNNWWGDPSGPYHPTFNPTGLGDEISNNVGYQPWLPSYQISSVIDYDYEWNTGATGSGTWVLFTPGSFVDAAGNGGSWVYQQANNLLFLSYSGAPCSALFVGTYTGPGVLSGQMFCRSGSSASGTWSGVVATLLNTAGADMGNVKN